MPDVSMCTMQNEENAPLCRKRNGCYRYTALWSDPQVWVRPARDYTIEHGCSNFISNGNRFKILTIEYEEQIGQETGDVLFRLVTGEEEHKVSVKESDMRDDYQTVRLMRGARAFILARIGDALFPENYQMGRR